MDANKAVINTIDEYIAQFPPELQQTLQTLRKVIQAAAPEAKEKIAWGMPAFVLNGYLVFFAAHKQHIGFYPAGSSGIEAFKNELADYKTSKGAVQFPLNEPLPYELITRMVKFRVAENTGDAKEKS
jgi:uncharacterized protein YdhG (YjbR/CyaY superfamily)